MVKDELLANPVCGFLEEEKRESQRSVALSMVEQKSDGVREDLPQQPPGQVPEVLGPHPRFMEYRSVS